jgi:hypothetical protein
MFGLYSIYCTEVNYHHFVLQNKPFIGIAGYMFGVRTRQRKLHFDPYKVPIAKLREFI